MPMMPPGYAPALITLPDRDAKYYDERVKTRFLYFNIEDIENTEQSVSNLCNLQLVTLSGVATLDLSGLLNNDSSVTC